MPPEIVGWLKDEFDRARERGDLLPLWARPVLKRVAVEAASKLADILIMSDPPEKPESRSERRTAPPSRGSDQTDHGRYHTSDDNCVCMCPRCKYHWRAAPPKSSPPSPPPAGEFKLDNTDRPDWDKYFLHIANAVAGRADCKRAKHGAVIVKNNRIVATGYNGAPAGKPGCLTADACPRGQKSYEELASRSGNYSDCIAVHAEANALLYADRDRCETATIYITGEPCDGCQKLIEGAGISRVVYP